ncbi:unnamed protein product [Rotaria socialis]|uniref:C2H2-type domain-containing protein n=1 Tax=Rotaria socialis TaxID=392032 RepID=A0A820T1U1_9BILA|nr:unnamed protein product [Rotaria socialis]CAF4458854.1 unnamed protein product [Rotaria socialis]
MCHLSGCSSTFEFSAELDSHISANLHKVPPPNSRTSNDMVRLHLIEAVRSINTQTNRATDRVRKQNDIIDGDVSNSVHAQHISSAGRTLLTRKHNNTMSEKTINFIEDISLNSHKNGSKLTPDQVQHQIRTQRDHRKVQKLFRSQEYPTINQIKYHFRILGLKHGVTAKQELIAELFEQNAEYN